MKIRKHIVPALILSSSALALMPTTSCNKSVSNSSSFQFIKNGKKIEKRDYLLQPKKFTKTFKASPELDFDPYFTSEATQSYYTDVAKNPKIYCDDVFGAFVERDTKEIPETAIYNLKLTVQNISVNWMRINRMDVPILSLDFIIKTQYKDGEKISDTETISLSFKNMIPSGLMFNEQGLSPTSSLYLLSQNRTCQFYKIAFIMAGTTFNANYEFGEEKFSFSGNTPSDVTSILSIVSARNMFIKNTFTRYVSYPDGFVKLHYYSNAVEKE